MNQINPTRFAVLLSDYVHDWLRSAWHSSKLDALLSLAQSFSDGANTSTDSTAVAVRAMAAAEEDQVKSVFGVQRTERTRPVFAELTHAARISTEAPASSRQEDTLTVDFTGYKITLVPALGCPSPLAVITEFSKLCAGRHAPTAAPVLTGSVVLTGRADARLTINLVDTPTTIILAVKAVKAVAPVVT